MSYTNAEGQVIEITKQYSEGVKFTIPDEINKTGYIFKGWSDGNTTYTAGQEVDANKNYSLTPVYEGKPATITINYSDVNGEPAQQTISKKFGDTLNLNELVSQYINSDRYVFDGWYDNADYTGEALGTSVVLDEAFFGTGKETYTKELYAKTSLTVNKVSFTFNGDYKIRKWLTSKTSISFTDAKWFDIYDASKEDGITNTMGLDYYFSRALSLPPTFRGTNENGDYLYVARWDLSDTITEINLDAYERDNNSNKLNLNQSLVFDLYDGLSLKLTGIWYIFDTNKEYFNKDIYIRYNTVNKDHKSYALHDRTFDQTYNAVLNYDNQITKDHYLSAMLGFEYYDSYYKGFSASGSGAPTDDFADLGLTDPGEGKRNIDSSHSRQRIMSFFGRINYDYQSKYLLSLVMRRDGYSKLAKDNRWGIFPGVSAGWVFGKESFMEPLSNIISFAKLRTSYGLNGNVNPNWVGNYTVQGSYSTNTYNGNVGFLLGSLPIPYLQWEKSQTFEVGLDLSFLANKINTNLTYYNRKTENKYASIPLPASSGVSSITSNNGKLQNQGLEMDFGFKLLNTKDWKLSATANISYNRNKLLEYDYSNPSIWGTTYVGYPLNLIISGKVQGIDPKYGIYTYEVRPDVVMQSASDRAIAENYAFYLGTSTAPTNGGYSITVGYKGVSLSLGGSYSINGKIVNNIESPADYREV